MAHIRNAIMEEHRASMEAYRKVHNETVRSELRMAMVQQSMKMDMWEIKWVLELTKRRRENSGQSYTCSDKVTKELNDVGLKGVHVIGSDVADGYGWENLPQTDSILQNFNSKDIDTCIGAPKSANNQGNMNTTCVGDQSRMPEKDVPSHGLRKQELGGLIFGAQMEIPVGFDLETFEGLQRDLGRVQERRTWNPGIIIHQPERHGLVPII
ncbi:hypothetical protein Tco_1314688 [Tanacetum coccineum]